MSVHRAGYFALAAGLLYCAATAAGSLLDSSYSQLAQPVSDLTATGAVTRSALILPYVSYNVLCFAFAFALYQTSAGDRLFKVGLGVLTINALAGIMMVTWFPEDKGGTLVTSAGMGHVVFAGVSSAAVVAATFVCGLAFRRSPLWFGLSAFSMGVGVGFMVLGPIAAIAVATKSHLAGLAERGPIGLFIFWLLIVGGYARRAGFTTDDGLQRPKR